MIIQLDIWGNISEYINRDRWYKQLFIDNEIIRYEDYLGNYWVKEYGNIQYPKLTFKEMPISDYLNYKYFFIHKQFISENNTIEFSLMVNAVDEMVELLSNRVKVDITKWDSYETIKKESIIKLLCEPIINAEL